MLADIFSVYNISLTNFPVVVVFDGETSSGCAFTDKMIFHRPELKLTDWKWK